MSELATAETLDQVDDVEPTPRAGDVLESASPLAELEVPQTVNLITEEEVLFSTAAAVAAHPTRWWTEATRVVAQAMRRIFVASPSDSGPSRRHYPPRAAYLEYSRMESEMHRL